MCKIGEKEKRQMEMITPNSNLNLNAREQIEEKISINEEQIEALQGDDKHWENDQARPHLVRVGSQSSEKMMNESENQKTAENWTNEEIIKVQPSGSPAKLRDLVC
uniref:Uncharacterized protein n=1 Tax=Nelumbo nucifera TaxID=4432 RepID=A0A822Y3X4_NELNU|nr:TPA_asm: hypothetical protein HUJ06_028171 [Nelumbo nucifera]